MYNPISVNLAQNICMRHLNAEMSVLSNANLGPTMLGHPLVSSTNARHVEQAMPVQLM